jgi:hypothetical protein
MFFYVDESGNTGNHLFDENQPSLYYGLLSSSKNLDVVAEKRLAKVRQTLGVTRIHANELGNKGLMVLLEDLLILQKQHDIRFDLYQVVKKDHAAICFFDQVFDSGMNEAVPWSAYWTPLRYFLLVKVAYLFDTELLKKAWAARLEIHDNKAEQALIEVCESLRGRLNRLPDRRSQEIIEGALLWVERNPGKISYNAGFKEHAMQVSPNLIGFQQVLYGIARQTVSRSTTARKIVVDQQSEFNASQQYLANNYKLMRNAELKAPPGMPQPNYSGMPEAALSFSGGAQSAGLEIVDVYLWVIMCNNE